MNMITKVSNFSTSLTMSKLIPEDVKKRVIKNVSKYVSLAIKIAASKPNTYVMDKLDELAYVTEAIFADVYPYEEVAAKKFAENSGIIFKELCEKHNINNK